MGILVDYQPRWDVYIDYPALDTHDMNFIHDRAEEILEWLTTNINEWADAEGMLNGEYLRDDISRKFSFIVFSEEDAMMVKIRFSSWQFR